MITWEFISDEWIAFYDTKKVGAVWQSLENPELFYTRIDSIRGLFCEKSLHEAMRIFEGKYIITNKSVQ